MCEPAVVCTPSVQNRSLMASGTPSSRPGLALGTARVGSPGHLACLVWRLGDEGVERAMLVELPEVRVRHFESAGLFLRHRRRELGEP
jgi:hypothetical protein